ncbi:hypothetical protein [Arthrobacter zhaoguopingii]|uniref:hypothetical protein n=1 Tax=Arthrobacter zhaoguopingii TaxID=2681491 RepID=UPI0013598DBD|nr:hypothetical protein [Arthrobacter zhaoguopingii]
MTHPQIDPAQRLEETALELTKAGFLIHALAAEKRPAHPKGFMDGDEAVIRSSEEALLKVVKRETTGISVFAGTKALYERGGKSFILTAFEFEGKASADPEFCTEWDTAVERFQFTEAWSQLDNGWKERTPSGGMRWFFGVEAPDSAYAAELKGVSGSLAVRRGGQTYAELLVGKGSIIAAPSYGAVHATGKPYERVSGGPDAMPFLSFREVNELSELLAEMDEMPRTKLSEIVGPNLLDGRQRSMLSQYNRQVSDDELAQMIVDAGWKHHGKDKSGTHNLSMADGHGLVQVGGPRHEGAAWTFSTSATPLWPEKHMRPADVLCVLRFGGDYEAMLAKLQADGLVRHEPWPLGVRRLTEVRVEDTNRNVLAMQIGKALQEAKHPTARGIPFVLALVHPKDGSMVAPISLGTEHELRRWHPTQRETLLLSVVQPVKRVKKEVKYQHGLPSTIIEAVLPSGRVPEGMSAVRYAATEPVLLPDGSTVSAPGHHPLQHALVAIPHRERAFWAAYKVPASPTLPAVQSAAEFVFDEVLVDFPFETKGDKVRALGYLLTAASRNLYGPCPGWLLDAAERGTGKSLLAGGTRYIANGSSAYTGVGYSRDTDVETTKAVVAGVLAGTKHLHVDELPRGDRVNSKVLMELITADGSTRWRVLGSSTEVSIPPMLITVCGNNVEVGGDSNRRFIPIRMVNRDSILAFERTGFRHDDLMTWIKQNRPQLLAALHTILAYGLQHPVSLSSLPKGYGSFEEWMTVLGSSLYYVDVSGTRAIELFSEGRREFVEENDDEADEWAPLMEAWVKRFGENQYVTAKEAHDAFSATNRTALDLPTSLLPTLGVSDAGLIKSWGRAISARRDTSVPHAGAIYRFDVRRDAKRGNKFRVYTVLDGAGVQPLHAVQPAASVTTISSPVVHVASMHRGDETPKPEVETGDVTDFDAA